MDFEVLIDGRFLTVLPTSMLKPCDNKHVLSLINGFENGGWRYNKFQNFIWDNVAETSLSHKERTSLIEQPHTKLIEAAKNLRLTDVDDDIGKGSELAEIVLYGIMRHHYKALPVVPKIFYKQNVQDNAKGADSVHIIVNDDDFTVWFGEAKFYTSIEDARLASIVTSVRNSLEPDKLKKENRIITNIPDIDTLDLSSDLRERIKAVLSSEASLDDLKPKLHIPILLLHQCNITRGRTELSVEYKQEIIEYHKERAAAYFAKHIDGLKEVFKYEAITFHIILFPVPCKKTIVDKFVANVKHFKDK